MGFTGLRFSKIFRVRYDVARRVGWRWAAPELQRPGERDTANAVVEKPNDVYGMGMAVYEVSPRDPFVLLWHLISAQVLARDIPFCVHRFSGFG